MTRGGPPQVRAGEGARTRSTFAVRALIVLVVVAARPMACKRAEPLASSRKPVYFGVVEPSGFSGCLPRKGSAFLMRLAGDAGVEQLTEFDPGFAASVLSSTKVCRVAQCEPPIVEQFDPLSSADRRSISSDRTIYPSSILALNSRCWIGTSEGVTLIDFAHQPPTLSNVASSESPVSVLAWNGADSLVAVEHRLPGAAWVFRIDRAGGAHRRYKSRLTLDSEVLVERGVLVENRLYLLTVDAAPTRVQQLSRWELGPDGIQFRVARAHRTTQPPRFPSERWSGLAIWRDQVVTCATDQGMAVFSQSFDAESRPLMPYLSATCDDVRAVDGKLFALVTARTGEERDRYLLGGRLTGSEFVADVRVGVPLEAHELLF